MTSYPQFKFATVADMLEYVSLVCGNFFYDTTVEGGSLGAAEGATVPEKTSGFYFGTKRLLFQLGQVC